MMDPPSPRRNPTGRGRQEPGLGLIAWASQPIADIWSTEAFWSAVLHLATPADMCSPLVRHCVSWATQAARSSAALTSRMRGWDGARVPQEEIREPQSAVPIT